MIQKPHFIVYVDKPLSGIKAVQTLSRLNRADPQKSDCFVLDFQNNREAITYAFPDSYRNTLLADETDPDKLHGLKTDLTGRSSPPRLMKLHWLESRNWKTIRAFFSWQWMHKALQLAARRIIAGPSPQCVYGK